jgi:hypothetical protein
MHLKQSPTRNQRRPSTPAPLREPIKAVLFDLFLDRADEFRARQLLAAVCESESELQQALAAWRLGR